MTWGFSRVSGNGSASSCAKLPSGDSVPEVSSMQRTLSAASARIDTPASKHQNDSVGASNPSAQQEGGGLEAGAGELCFLDA